ncbi:MAG: hypothetical protein JST02_05145 [Bacteroidetes bacterium]|nr:hypothetical protein [Bacteroidota bacterium]
MYSKYTTDELIEAYNSMLDYSGQLSPELSQEIELRGGIKSFENLIIRKKIVDEEIKRLSTEIFSFANTDVDIEFIKGKIKSEVLSKQEVNNLIESKFYSFKKYKVDQYISKDVYIQSLIATLAASVIGGMVLALLVFFITPVFLYFIIPIYLIDYLIIHLITKKTRRNIIVFISILVSTIISIILGVYLAGMFLPAA